VQRFVAARLLRNKDPAAVAKFIHEHRPKDVIAQWEKLENAQGLAFIAPVFWLYFPAILKEWFDRVFAYGDAYALTSEGWHGEASMKRHWSSARRSSKEKAIRPIGKCR
jgi:NAD(P)H dehydrogenase (quinone)